jgi:ATP-dependent Clp protease, protease subunit
MRERGKAVTIPNGQPQIAPGATIYVSFSAEINAHTTESLIAIMANCANARPAQVNLLLSTPGGVVMNGINLYNVLRALPFKLVTHNVGNVDSIGNALFLAGQERYACPHSTFMFHGVASNVPAGCQLEAKQLRERLRSTKADELRIGSIIEQRTKLSHREVAALFREARTMDAAKAVSAGIVHHVDDVKIPPGSPVVSLVFQR